VPGAGRPRHDPARRAARHRDDHGELVSSIHIAMITAPIPPSAVMIMNLVLREQHFLLDLNVRIGVARLVAGPGRRVTLS
jgi:hypothetical protein